MIRQDLAFSCKFWHFRATVPFSRKADPAAEISRLRRENDRLRTERDILKKAVAIFSEPPR
jgi:transposase-like protein